jgi:hypothetical protein
MNQPLKDAHMSTLDEGLMATLTQEEREAMKEDDATNESVDAIDQPDDEAKSEELARNEPATDASDASSVDTKSEQTSDTEQLTQESTQVEVVAPDTDPPQPRTQPIPRYDSKLPEDFDAQVKSLSDKEAELKRQFKAGELEFDDFDVARAALQSERELLTIARTKAEISQEMNAQTAEQLWTHAVNQFMDSTARLSEAAGGIDYRKDTEKWSDLDGFVRSLAARNEYAHQSMDWFLEEAHKRVLALHGMAVAPAKNAETEDADASKLVTKTLDRKPLDRKPPLDIAPKTLALVPGGEGPGDVDGEFADVLSLEGLAYEQAIARMSPTERERFLRAA